MLIATSGLLDGAGHDALAVAEERRRPVNGTGVEAVICARRLS